jgi:hypothetical protein
MNKIRRSAVLSCLFIAAASAASAQTSATAGLGRILGGGDNAAKSRALDGFFDSAQARKSEPDAVSAGAWGAAASGALPSAGGGSVRAAAAAVTVPSPRVPKAKDNDAPKPAKGPVESAGDALRDRNDKKLQDATKQQKETEKAWKDYKNGDRVSPKPPTADEVSIGGKG